MRGESASSVLSLCGDGFQEVIEKKPDEKERLKAAELIGKRFGIFTDKMKVDVEPVVIVNDLKE
jgi:phage terminase small subunit